MSNRLPDGWKIKLLSDLAFVDKEVLKNSTSPDYRFRYIDIASVKTGSVNITSTPITFAQSPSRARKRVRKGDVLMSTVRPNLQSFAYFDREGCEFVASTGFAVITPKSNSCSLFLYQSILSDEVTRQIATLVAGSNYPAISSQNVKNLELPAPPLPEQQKIATILSSVDDVIEKTRAQIDKLKDLKTGMMQELLTKGIGPDGGPHTAFKDSPVGRIPASWKALQVSDLLSERKQKGIEGLPIYSVLVEGGLVPRESVERRVASELDFSDNRLAKKGDLVYNMMRMWQGALGIAPIDCLVSPAYVVCSPTKEIEPEFLAYSLKNLDSIKKLERYSQGLTSDRLRLYFQSFSRMVFAIPPLNEQRLITKAIKSIDNELSKKILQLSAREKVKKALMEDLLTGKVRVNIEHPELVTA